jgi:hypothetical protein
MYVKEFTTFYTMTKHKPLTSYEVQNYMQLILKEKHDLFINGSEVSMEDDFVWNIEFTYV